MINKQSFINDMEELKALADQAEKLQEDFCNAADNFKEKYKDIILKDTKNSGEEWVLYFLQGYHHRFAFHLFRISKKNSAATTKEDCFIGLDKFSDLEFINETLESRVKRLRLEQG